MGKHLKINKSILTEEGYIGELGVVASSVFPILGLALPLPLLLPRVRRKR